MLRIENVSKNFGGIKAVDHCQLNIPQGKITALIGPNGSGKSTLFNLISGVLKPDSGRIFLNDTELTRLSVDKIANLGVARIFQKSRLFDNLTLEDNLLLALDTDDQLFWKNFLGLNKPTVEEKKQIQKVLQLVDLQKNTSKLGRELSYGQKRLVEIMRAVIKPHQLLLLDEPLAGVNPKLKKRIFDFLLTLKKNFETILIVEHDVSFVFNLADQVVVMDKGVVIAQGNSAQTLKNKKVIKAYLGGE